MAGRILNRRELRKQSDQAGQPDATGAAVVAKPPKAVKTKAPAKPKAPRKSRKKEPPRLRARWGVFDGSMKQVAIFDYNQRAAADQKVADLNAKKGGSYLLQIVKEPMPEPAPVEETPA